MRRFKIDYTCVEPQASENPFFRSNCGTATEPSSVGMWMTFFTLFNNLGGWVRGSLGACWGPIK